MVIPSFLTSGGLPLRSEGCRLLGFPSFIMTQLSCEIKAFLMERGRKRPAPYVLINIYTYKLVVNRIVEYRNRLSLAVRICRESLLMTIAQDVSFLKLSINLPLGINCTKVQTSVVLGLFCLKPQNDLSRTVPVRGKKGKEERRDDSRRSLSFWKNYIY